MSESDVCRRQILTSKVYPRAVRVNTPHSFIHLCIILYIIYFHIICNYIFQRYLQEDFSRIQLDKFICWLRRDSRYHHRNYPKTLWVARSCELVISHGICGIDNGFLLILLEYQLFQCIFSTSIMLKKLSSYNAWIADMWGS